MRRARLQFVVSVIALLTASRAAADASRAASIAGQVVDPSDAVVRDAEVGIRCRGDREERRTTTDEIGHFAFGDLRAGECEIRASHEGFRAYVGRVRAADGAATALTLKLALLEVAEEVTVSRGDAADAAENRDAVAVDQRMLESLPVFDQDYVAALAGFLDPAALGSGGASLVVDGVEANRVAVSPSAVQEIKINQNPYSAEYFRPGRGRIEIVTKQEAPEYHGTFNALLRDAVFNAREPFAPTKAPEQRRVFEGSLSGPVGARQDITFLLTFSRKEDDAQAVVRAVTPEGEVLENVATPQRNTDLSARLTRRFGSKHVIWAQYAREERTATNQGAGGFTLPEAADDTRYRESDLDVSDQLNVSPHWINQLTAHLEWNHGSTSSLYGGPRIVVQDAFTRGGAQADETHTEADLKLFDTSSWSFGKHLVKAGLQVAEWSHRTYDDASNREGTYFFSSLGQYDAGQPYAFRQQTGDGEVALLQEVVGGFVQDEVRLRPDLSLAVGLRYDYQNLLHAGLVSPRIFSAFAPSRAVTLRAGAGVFNDRFPPSAFADTVRFDGQHLSSVVVLDPSYPYASAVIASVPTNRVVLAAGIRTPYTIQYSFGAEWKIAEAASLTATYRGTRGVSLFRSRNVNAPSPPSYLTRPLADAGDIREIESAGRQAGDALELSFRGKLRKWLTGLVQYTLSRTRNNTSGVGFLPARNEAPLAEWGLADFDQPHRLNALATGALGATKIGVALTAASGKPYSLTTGLDDNHDGVLNDRPTGVGRNTLRAPGYVDLDLTVSRDFRLGHAKGDTVPTLTLGIGAFNIANTLQVLTVEGNQLSTFFGQAVTALPRRRIQATARAEF
jgi:hypothetical protein